MKKAKAKTTEAMVEVPEAALLSLVANSLKDRVLFPEKLESAKRFVKEVRKNAQNRHVISPPHKS